MIDALRANNIPVPKFLFDFVIYKAAKRQTLAAYYGTTTETTKRLINSLLYGRRLTSNA